MLIHTHSINILWKHKYGTRFFTFCLFHTLRTMLLCCWILLFANDFVILRRRVAQDEYTVIYDRILVFCVVVRSRVRTYLLTFSTRTRSQILPTHQTYNNMFHKQVSNHTQLYLHIYFENILLNPFLDGAIAIKII